MSEWQPIETAPKDGTWVLLYSPEDGGQMFVATWEPTNYSNPPQWAYGPSGIGHSFRRGVYDVTHWIPLPPAPTSAE